MRQKTKYLFFTVALCLAACATYVSITQEMREAFHRGEYKKAISALDESDLRESNKNRLLYLLEKSMIYDRMNDLDRSRKLLFRADQVVDELYTTSITKTAATFLLNESAADYEGENFEKVAIHTILSLSFIQEHNYSSALVQARRMNNKLYEIAQRLGDRHNSYREDAFARYLSALSYEAKNEIDDAIIDYKKSYDIYHRSSYSKFFNGTPGKDVADVLYRLAKKRGRSSLMSLVENRYPDLKKTTHDESADIVVIHEVGRISRKKAHEFIIPIGRQVVRFSFPHIKSRSVSCAGVGVRVDNGRFVSANNFSNLSAIAHYTLEERRLRFLLKGGARILLKATLTEKAHESFGPLGGILANVVSVVTETADTRSWTLLPAGFCVSRIQVSPGEHSIGIQNSSSPHYTKVVHLKAGELLLLRSRDI